MSAASTASAARAPSSSMESPCARASCWPFRPMVMSFETLKAWPEPAGELNPLQSAFRNAHGLQCGFCTPGFLMTLTAFLRDTPEPERRRDSRRAVRESLPLHRLPSHLRGGQACLQKHATLARASSGTKMRGCSPAARCSWTTCRFRGCCMWRSFAVTMRTGGSSSVDVSLARERPGVVAVYTADDLATT